ncbi:DUF4249 family protein [Roseivirga sp. E12]|uniref:DUF4249 family protein n=1 Tax=Roseivirga sp. E12 TaxID=2819237 RepID=UPI001ABC337A|nr:DUF4249 family protein [Roseivirga sp. E12]MBO3698979.1 DUF4249 domain-containing protein [Roseivirga sp. E12]
MRKTHVLYLLSLVLISMLFTQCAEVIELNNQTSGGQLVIAGRITNGTMGNVVNISRALPEEQAPELISGALVKVIDQDGLEEAYVETAPGQYELCRDVVQGQVGGVYQLEVQVDGKTYTSSLQEMMPILAEDELRFELDIQDNTTGSGTATSTDVVRIFANSTLNSLPEEFYIRWTMEESYTITGMNLPLRTFPRYSPQVCYIINELSAQEIFLVDGTEIRNVNLNNREVAVRPVDRSFSTKHYFNIIQLGLNRESHEYWSKLQSLTVRQGSIFDTPPAAVPGNFQSSDPSEQVFGFFEASSADTTRLLMTNNDIPLFFLDPCQVDQETFLRIIRVPFECISCLIEREIVEAECIYCSLLPNSTLARPSYF